MVVRLTGNVNGETVLFQRIGGDVWETTVPSSIDGVYVVDMTAYDEAGNEAFWAKYILTVDLASLCAHLYRHPYQAEILECDYVAALCECEIYCAEVLQGRCDINDACRF